MELGEDSLKYPVEWTRIAPCRFRKFGDQGETLDRIRERSEKRRQDSEEFKLYSKLLEQIESVYQSHTLPLDLESRLKQSRSEREILELQRELAEKDGSGDEDSKEKKDIILQESLKIITDMVSLQPLENGQETSSVDMQRNNGVMERIKDWLRSEQ